MSTPLIFKISSIVFVKAKERHLPPALLRFTRSLRSDAEAVAVAAAKPVAVPPKDSEVGAAALESVTAKLASFSVGGQDDEEDEEEEADSNSKGVVGTPASKGSAVADDKGQQS